MMFGGEFFLLLYSFAFVVVGVLCLSSSPLVASAAATPSIKAKANNYYQNNNNKNNNNNNWAEQSRRYLQEDSGVNETETVTVTVNDNAEVVNLEDDNDNKVCHIPTNWDPDKPVGGGGIDIKPKYTVGVLAIRGFDAAYAEFNATFNEYLTATAGQKFDPPIEFELKPLDFLTLFSDAEFRQVDFIYVNPSAYSCIESEYKSYSLASQVSRRKVKGQIYDLEKFGGVIATLSNRDDINTVLDLKDQRVAAASISGLGSGQMQFKAMIDNGMNYLDDPKQLVFTSNQGLVVKGLLAGQFDVGFIRTDQLERSKDADGNPVDINKFKVINPQPDLEINGVKFPFNSSTELYAEWNIAALTHVSQDVSREVQQAMLNVATYADIGKSVDRCYQTNINSTTVDCNQIPLSKLYTSGPIPCGVTNDIAVKALNAQTNGKYAEWTTSLSYMQLRSMQEAVGFIKKDPESLTWRCIRSAELYDAISCPDGYSLKSKEEVDTACAISGLDCGEGFQCICRPCEMPYERQCIDSVPIGERCVELYIFIPSIILPILLLVGIIVHYYVEYKRKQSDSVWIVKIDELDFGDGSATIIGQGTFGLVLLAEYRGTQVAVKRVIPPGTERDSLFDPRKSTSKWSASVDSWGGGGSILEDVENGEYIIIVTQFIICIFKF
jgi:ABC-type phosphate/phosphonate transport system substrate-binding protein